MQTTTTELITLQNRLTTGEAAKVSRKSPSCIFRWWRDGVRGVHLECIRLGRTLYTSEAALEKFGREVAQAHAEQRTAAADARDSEPVAGL